MESMEFPPDNNEDFGKCYWYLFFLVFHFKSTIHQKIQGVYKMKLPTPQGQSLPRAYYVILNNFYVHFIPRKMDCSPYTVLQFPFFSLLTNRYFCK